MLSVEPVWDSLFLCPYPIPLEKEGRKERKKEESRVSCVAKCDEKNNEAGDWERVTGLLAPLLWGGKTL